MTHPNLRQLVAEINKIPEDIDDKLTKLYSDKDKLCAHLFILRKQYKNAKNKEEIALQGKIAKSKLEAISKEIESLIK